jgi:hypothetical protein
MVPTVQSLSSTAFQEASYIIHTKKAYEQGKYDSPVASTPPFSVWPVSKKIQAKVKKIRAAKVMPEGLWKSRLLEAL